MRRVRSAASARRTRSRSAGCRRRAAPRTLVASAQGGRGPHFARNDDSRVYFTTNRGLQSITMDGYDRRTLLRITGSGPGNNPPGADDIRLSPDGSRAFVSLQGKHYLVTVPRAGRETVEVRIQGRGDTPPSRSSAMSLEGGDYLDWTADGKAVTWAWGAQFFRQPIDAAEPQKTDIVVELPRSRPKGSVLLTGARIITMKGTEVIPQGDVLVTDNRIAADRQARLAHRARRARAPSTSPARRSCRAWSTRTRTCGRRAALHQTEVWQYLANLAYGVTTTRDPQTSTPDVFAYADMVDAGMMPGPRVYATGPGRVLRFRHRQPRGRVPLHQALQGGVPHQHPQAVRRRRSHRPPVDHRGVQGVRHHRDDRRLARSQVEPDADGRRLFGPGAQPADRAALQGRDDVRREDQDVLHADDPRGLRRAVDENYWFETESPANDAKLRKWVPWELLDGMVRRRPQWFLPEEYGHNLIAKGVADVVHAGGRAGLGSHGQLQGLGAHWETWNLASGGLTPHETLQVVTMFSAEAIGLQQDVGSLEAGKLADLLVLDRNPLENIKNTNSIRYVMKNGELYEGDTLNMVWPQTKPLPKQFWWDTEPSRSQISDVRLQK